MPTDADSPILSATVDEFQKIKKLADKAIAQLSDAQLEAKIDPEANSVAIIMRHMAGNMRSRWVDFITSDGEKPDRMRDREFEDVPQARAALVADWEHGWRCVFDALAPLTDADLQRTVVIRGEPHSVYKAMSRQVTHYAGHAYQILLLAKHLLGPEWKTLSIPRGQSEEFNRRMLAKLKGA
ncbi:MAG: hypothetical protein A3J29_15555 [Acidobacteria bacterium RIFCSPLOWO2_12_FULL_67_14b]|nr:MAG: hypothetical protein A3J29_15555 [Acidobacteria bacterium RIFCSPLOWO2_12_FULL_67_14b]